MDADCISLQVKDENNLEVPSSCPEEREVPDRDGDKDGLGAMKTNAWSTLTLAKEHTRYFEDWYARERSSSLRVYIHI